jgi:hypothetical protein
MRQMTLAHQAEFQRYSKKTRREQFLEEMDAVVPWAALMALVEPHYPKGETGRKPVGLEIMLRVYFLQQWFALSDPGVEDALYESPVLRRFVDPVAFATVECLQKCLKDMARRGVWNGCICPCADGSERNNQKSQTDSQKGLNTSQCLKEPTNHLGLLSRREVTFDMCIRHTTRVEIPVCRLSHLAP